MVQELSNGDRLVTRIVQTEVWQVLRHRTIQSDLALFDQLHDGRGDKRLGHGGHMKESVRCHATRLAESHLSKTTSISQVSVEHDSYGQTGNVIFAHSLSDELIEMFVPARIRRLP